MPPPPSPPGSPSAGVYGSSIPYPPDLSSSAAGAPAYSGVPPWVRLRALLSFERNEMWIAVIYSAAIGVLSLVTPIATQALVNTIAFGNLVQPLLVLTLIVLAGLGVLTVFQALRIQVVEILQRRVFVRCATQVLHRLLRARRDAFDEHYGPELVNRFFDVVTVQKSAAMLLLDGLSVLMQTTAGLIVLAIYHPWLLAFDLILIVLIFIVLVPMGSGAIETCIRESKAKYQLVAWFEELPRHPLSFRSPAAMAYATGRTDALVRNYLTYRAKHFRVLLRQIIGSIGLGAIATASLLGVGGLLVMQRQLTLGQLVAAELIVAMVIAGFSKFGKHLEVFYDMMAAIDKLGQLTDLPQEEPGGEAIRRESRGASVTIRELRFGYPGRPPLFDRAESRSASRRARGAAGAQRRGQEHALRSDLRFVSAGLRYD
jgi:putative ABC transport system ATP-binding protein